MTGKKPVEILSSLIKKTSIPVAVAGGLNSETVVEVVKAGASIIIVGGAITKAKDATKATRDIKKAIDNKKIVKTEHMFIQ